ncbi:hypothetical protein [Rhodoferax sp. GW822-FHT02A01]|uniref:hypothetical protein n=1 Tax=Rhodoferax sp. GW822-FHT02A01 TaxID=3141537 RepID=UPI00315C547F
MLPKTLSAAVLFFLAVVGTMAVDRLQAARRRLHPSESLFNDTMPYPHTVAMAKDLPGRKTIYMDEMVPGCMMMPMAA